MATMTRRLQVLLDEQRYLRLRELAARRDRTVAELVRDALDRAYPAGEFTAAEAGERLLGRPPLDDLHDPVALEAEIESLHEPRA